jgi:hypothetical protein
MAGRGTVVGALLLASRNHTGSRNVAGMALGDGEPREVNLGMARRRIRQALRGRGGAEKRVAGQHCGRQLATGGL